MKTGAAGINSHILLECTTLADCVLLVLRDGTELGFTSHDRDIVYDGVTYARESAITRSSTSANNGISLQTLDLDGLINADAFDEDDIRAGVLDGASVYLFLINWAKTSDGIIKLVRGSLGDITLKSGIYTLQINGLQKKLQNEILRIYSPLCDAEFGDATTGCGYDLAAVQQSGTVDSASDKKNFISTDITITTNDEMNMGRIAFTTGDNAGATLEIKDSATDGSIELYLSAPFSIGAGDEFTIVPGCNKLFSTCKNNGQALNFRGFPDLPGEDARFVTDMALR